MKAFLEVLFIVFLGLGLLGLFYFLMSETSNTNNRFNSCQKECEIFVAKVMDDSCFCKSNTGWDFKYAIDENSKNKSKK